MSITIKSKQEVNVMRQAGKVVANLLKTLSEQVRSGMRTEELDSIAAIELEKAGAKSSFKGYHGFPACLCVSVNDEIVHGIPGKRILREGDIVSLDFGAIVDGFHGDAAVTVGVGEISSQARRLIKGLFGSAGVCRSRHWSGDARGASNTQLWYGWDRAGAESGDDSCP